MSKRRQFVIKRDILSPLAVILSNLSLKELLVFLKVPGQAAGAGLLVKGRKILAGLLHHLYYVIEGHAVLAVGE